MSGRKLFQLVVCVVVVGLPTLFYYLHIKPWEVSEGGYASWQAGGGGGGAPRLMVRVRDRSGRPVPGAVIGLSNNSGGDGGVADANGVALIDPGEGDIRWMAVNGHEVIDRPYAYELGTPSLSKGLIVDVVLSR